MAYYVFGTIIKMKTISLFSGCGGMDIGASAAGAEIILANDSNPFACETLRSSICHHHTDIICGDAARLTDFPDADLLIGGYPCQSFSMGGNRDPANDHRTQLYEHFARCLNIVSPKFFIAENVSGLRSLNNGHFFDQQLHTFGNAGKYGYHLSQQVLDAKNFGVPQNRKRLFIVGVRQDLEQQFSFPAPTHGVGLLPYTSHGECLRGLSLWPDGEFYQRNDNNNFSWYFMSRNRKANWHDPSYTVVANWRHITLHPGSPTMHKISSNLADGSKQEWAFTNDYEHRTINPDLPTLPQPRRLSWRECARIQTFPDGFEPAGNVAAKFTQIGNAVPPELARILVKHVISGEGLQAQKS